ncbi:hypothetical protein AAON49_00800 [Pseudotenacibaculum sp. MALMAid0570]|uniref:IS1096 element passenger TnpR family protein n=1 Tax=Pseudotenacibaculum sp. MALMAid0570 TaxID=3143938 RepID=UPI0032DEF8F1
MYKIRVILDTQEDVIRTVLVDRSINLETLHYIIARSFGFDGQEMASFYRTDHDWNQGEEIPLFSMSEAGEGISMQNSFLRKSLPNVNDKLIYVYDFFNMWTFYVEAIEILEKTNQDLPKTILSVGEIPQEAPEKEFVAENFGNENDDEFGDEFESLDDIDFDNY